MGYVYILRWPHFAYVTHPSVIESPSTNLRALAFLSRVRNWGDSY